MCLLWQPSASCSVVCIDAELMWAYTFCKYVTSAEKVNFLPELHHGSWMNFHESLLARDSIYAIACYMPSPVCPSARLSVCPSVTRGISQRRLKLGSRNLHHRVAP